MKQILVYITIQTTLLMSLFLSSNAQVAKGKSIDKLNLVERTDAFKINLLSPFYGTVNVSWQHVLSNEKSFQITASYMDFDSYGSTTDNSNGGSSSSSYGSSYPEITQQVTKGYTIVPEYRINLNGRGLSGSYLAPFARFMAYEYVQTERQQKMSSSPPYNYSYVTVNEKYTYQSLGFGVIVGKQTIFKNLISVDFFAGPVYSFLLQSSNSVSSTSDIAIGSGIPNLYIRGYGVRAGFTIGFVK